MNEHKKQTSQSKHQHVSETYVHICHNIHMLNHILHFTQQDKVILFHQQARYNNIIFFHQVQDKTILFLPHSRLDKVIIHPTFG